MPLRIVFGPLLPDSPYIRSSCKLCGVSLKEGDFTTFLPQKAGNEPSRVHVVCNCRRTFKVGSVADWYEASIGDTEEDDFLGVAVATPKGAIHDLYRVVESSLDKSPDLIHVLNFLKEELKKPH